MCWKCEEMSCFGKQGHVGNLNFGPVVGAKCGFFSGIFLEGTVPLCLHFFVLAIYHIQQYNNVPEVLHNNYC